MIHDTDNETDNDTDALEHASMLLIIALDSGDVAGPSRALLREAKHVIDRLAEASLKRHHE